MSGLLQYRHVRVFVLFQLAAVASRVAPILRLITLCLEAK